jgi:hypothetical protein
MILRTGVLDVEKVSKRPKDHDKRGKVKRPGGCVDELVSPQQQLGFNAVEIFTSDE